MGVPEMSKHVPSTKKAERAHASATTARRALKRLWSGWSVHSCADGTLRIKPTWRKQYLKPGLLTRLYSAAMVEDVINGKQ